MQDTSAAYERTNTSKTRWVPDSAEKCLIGKSTIERVEAKNICPEWRYETKETKTEAH